MMQSISRGEEGRNAAQLLSDSMYNAPRKQSQGEVDNGAFVS
jgi:hypothetical protein